jgi:hypothetical protein
MEYGNYTQERDTLFKDVTLDEILATMKKSPNQQNDQHRRIASLKGILSQ